MGGPRKLDIQILITDPNCFGARLRSKAESREGQVLPGQLKGDASDIATIMQEMEKAAILNCGTTGVTFKCRLYRLPPILFLFLVDSACYVEQYHFWSKRKAGTPIPVTKYRMIDEPAEKINYLMHHEMENHFDWVWEHASISLAESLEQVAIGVEDGLKVACAANVYTDPKVSLKRMLYLLNNAKTEVAIQGISLRSFCQAGETGDLWLALMKLIQGGKVKIRMLFMDPVCKQAKFRSYREVRLKEPSLTWEQYDNNARFHEHSPLYEDTDRAIRTLAREVRGVVMSPPKGWKLNLKAARYESAPHCFLLRVDDSILIEQYHYGKILGSETSILGKEMPVIEFTKGTPDSKLYPEYPTENRREPFRLLDDHFTFAWELASEIDLLELAEQEYQSVHKAKDV